MRLKHILLLNRCSCFAGLGFDEPLLEELTSKNIRHTLAGVLYHTLNPENTHISIGNKALAGIVFSKRLGSKAYQSKCHILAMHDCVGKELIAGAEAFDPVKMKLKEDKSAISKMDYKQIAALTLAYALGPSPAQVCWFFLVDCLCGLRSLKHSAEALHYQFDAFVPSRSSTLCL